MLLLDGLPMGVAKEGVRLHWKLSCGDCYRLHTPHAITAEEHLLCRFCSTDEELVAAEKERPSGPECILHTWFHKRGLASQLRHEVKLGWLGGRVDFLHVPSSVLVQVDGQQHFAGKMHDVPSCTYMDRDVDMCAAAWQAGRTVVRVHHLDLPPSAGFDPVLQLLATPNKPTQPLLLLSPHYNLCAPHHSPSVNKHLALLDKLTEKLKNAYSYSTPNKAIYFMPSL